MRICPNCETRTTEAYCPVDRFATVDAALHEKRPSLEGAVFEGRYRLDARIGQGGMGTVWRATQLAVGRDVAVKILKADLAADLKEVARFQQEARAVASLRHPGVVALHDFGQAGDGSLFLVMEFIDGEPLDKLIARAAPMDPARVIHLGVQALDALAEAHRHGIIHRDLKPPNLLVTSMGREKEFVKVLDFGIAKVSGDASAGMTLTGTGKVIGTPRYMSPEQARDEALTPASDVYSMALILYELLTGGFPFAGRSHTDFLLAHISDPPKPPAVRGVPVSGPLAAFIMRCLRKRPEERPATALDALAELEACRTETRLAPIEAEPPPTAAYSPIPSTTGVAATSASPRRWFRLAGAFAAVLAVSGAGFWAMRQAEHTPDAAPEVAAVAESKPAPRDEASSVARRTQTNEKLTTSPMPELAAAPVSAIPAATAAPSPVVEAPDALGASLTGGRLVFADDFERQDFGDKWQAGSSEWRLEKGAIANHFAENKGLWLLERLPAGDVRIEFDARSDAFQTMAHDGAPREEFPGDIKCEAFATEPAHQKGYVFIFGGWQNRMNRIARIEEHGKGEGARVVDGPLMPVVAGHTYRMKVLRVGTTLAMYADFRRLVTLDDPELIRGEYFGFNNWRSHVGFDNVAVYALGEAPVVAADAPPSTFDSFDRLPADLVQPLIGLGAKRFSDLWGKRRADVTRIDPQEIEDTRRWYAEVAIAKLSGGRVVSLGFIDDVLYRVRFQLKDSLPEMPAVLADQLRRAPDREGADRSDVAEKTWNDGRLLVTIRRKGKDTGFVVEEAVRGEDAHRRIAEVDEAERLVYESMDAFYGPRVSSAEAVRLNERAVKLLSTFGDAWANLCHARYDQGLLAKAKDACDKAMEVTGEASVTGEAQYYAGLLVAQTGHRDKAILLLDLAMTNVPKDWSIAPAIRARLGGLRGKPNKAVLTVALVDLGCFLARGMPERASRLPAEFGFASRVGLEDAARATGLDVPGVIARGTTRCRQAR